MAKIVLPDNFLAVTQGDRELDLNVENYRDLVRQMLQRWPDLEGLLETTAVAIDGQIFQDAFLEPIEPTSEVFFMARIEGG